MKNLILICSALLLLNNHLTAMQDIELKDCNFESYAVRYTKEWTASLIKSDSTIAKMSKTTDGNGLNLKCSDHDGRGELFSPLLNLAPFTWYEVEIQYQTFLNQDSLISLAGLYPDKDRSLMDLVILPASPGNSSTRTFLLHTGSEAGNYRFCIAIAGIGSLNIYSIKYTEKYKYKIPEETILIVDLLKVRPDINNLSYWSAVPKFKELYGFNKPDYVHPLKTKRSYLKECDPGLIVFSPTAISADSEKLGMLRKRKFDKGVRKILDYAEKSGIPVLGICAGHQSIAVSRGAFLARLKDDSTQTYLTEIGPTNLQVIEQDPIFEGTVDKKSIKIIEAHMIMVHDNFMNAKNLARSKEFTNQIFRYDQPDGIIWYTFQGHVEKDWEYSCPEGAVIFNNILTNWKLIPSRNIETTAKN